MIKRYRAIGLPLILCALLGAGFLVDNASGQFTNRSLPVLASVSTPGIYLPVIIAADDGQTPIPTKTTIVQTSLPSATDTPTPIPTPTDIPGSATPRPSLTPIPGKTAQVVYAVGDVAECFDLPPDSTNPAYLTDKALGGFKEKILLLGDASNDNGAAADYANCFTPLWGNLKPRLYLAMGNHDNNYPTDDSAAYFAYFGAAAHPSTSGYYSFNLGGWHIVVLNTQCKLTGGCLQGSAQETWLKADLAANTKACTLGIFHMPMFTSGSQPPYATGIDFWRDLYAAHADLILNGHNHIYERFAPQNPDGQLDVANGIREIVVGTGGANHGGALVNPLAPNEEVREGLAFGYLKLVLYSNSYTWEYVPVGGSNFTDIGSGTCHPK